MNFQQEKIEKREDDVGKLEEDNISEELEEEINLRLLGGNKETLTIKEEIAKISAANNCLGKNRTESNREIVRYMMQGSANR